MYCIVRRQVTFGISSHPTAYYFILQSSGSTFTPSFLLRRHYQIAPFTERTFGHSYWDDSEIFIGIIVELLRRNSSYLELKDEVQESCWLEPSIGIFGLCSSFLWHKDNSGEYFWLSLNRLYVSAFVLYSSFTMFYVCFRFGLFLDSYSKSLQKDK